MEKNSLGQIIHKTLQQFYPNMKIPIRSHDIEEILNKAKINKKNSNKDEISKIIKILKHHIEIAQQNKIKKVEPQEYKPIFTNMEQEHTYLDKMREDLADNLKKIEEETERKKNTQEFNDSLIIKNFMNEEKVEFEYNIIIDSKDRDYDLFPSTSNFEISLGSINYGGEKKGLILRNFEEVISIELTECFMKSTSSVDDASDNPSVPPYLILNIEELGSRYEGTNDVLNKAFARLYDFEELEMGNNIKFREYQCENIVKIFSPRKNMTKLSIKILLPDGSPYSFGDDTVTTTLLSLGFKIKVLQKKLVSNYIDKTN